MNVNGQIVEFSGLGFELGLNNLISQIQHSGKRGVYISNVKKRNPDGTFQKLPSKRIIIE